MPRNQTQTKFLEIREREVQGFLDRGTVPPPLKRPVKLGVNSGDFDEVPMTAEQRAKYEQELAQIREQLAAIRQTGVEQI